MTSSDRYVVTLGETLGLLRLDEPGSLAHASAMTLSIGGSESNVAIGLQRLGVETAWIGRVGEDSLGRRVLREIRAEGVAVHAVIDSSAPTGLMLKERTGVETSQIWYYRSGSAGSRLSKSDIVPELIERAALLHITGITPALSDSATEAAFEAVERARSCDVPVSFDVNHRPTVWRDRDPSSAYMSLARKATLLFAGEDEGAILVGPSNPPEMAQRLARLGPRHVVVKRGAHGSFALSDGVGLAEPVVPVKVVDTVGAGDAFVAGYLAEWLSGAPLAHRLRTASIAGAMACETMGDWEGFPFRRILGRQSTDDPVRR